MGVEQGPSETDKNFKAPETGGQSDLDEERRRFENYYGKENIPVMNEESRNKLEAQKAGERADYYRKEMKQAKTAKERYQLGIRAQAETYFATHPEAANDNVVLKDFEEEQPQLFAEWQKLPGHMTPEQQAEAEEQAKNIKVT